MRFSISISISISMLFSMSSFAAYECSVSMTRILIYKSGAVNVLHTGRGDYTYICNLKEERDGVSIVTCAMWTSMLQSIKKENAQATFYYSGEGSCSTLPIYGSSPAPVYIGQI